jgi:hypothetical protein
MIAEMTANVIRSSMMFILASAVGEADVQLEANLAASIPQGN